MKEVLRPLPSAQCHVPSRKQPTLAGPPCDVMKRASRVVPHTHEQLDRIDPTLVTHSNTKRCSRYRRYQWIVPLPGLQYRYRSPYTLPGETLGQGGREFNNSLGLFTLLGARHTGLVVRKGSRGQEGGLQVLRAVRHMGLVVRKVDYRSTVIFLSAMRLCWYYEFKANVLWISGKYWGRGSEQQRELNAQLNVKIKLIFLNAPSCPQLAGCGVLGVGVWLRLAYSGYAALLPQYSMFSADSLCIAVGVIVFVIAFFGCCGSWFQSRCMLITSVVWWGVLPTLPAHHGEHQLVVWWGVFPTLPAHHGEHQLVVWWGVLPTLPAHHGEHQSVVWWGVFPTLPAHHEPVGCCQGKQGLTGLYKETLSSHSLSNSTSTSNAQTFTHYLMYSERPGTVSSSWTCPGNSPRTVPVR
uniref:Uncharacterized protein n=1 Tax=Timema bartmani TaxID=61472 RepID=A0A7R9EXG9_9NEOP|nr:unnamed protein product [Timema bartmani]